MMQELRKIRFFDSITQQEIETSAIEIALPNGQRFQIDSRPGRDDAAVFHMPADPARRRCDAFVIEPGAANLFAVNVASWSRTGTDAADDDELASCALPPE